MAQVRQQPPSIAEQERISASYTALREDRDRGLDLATRQRLHIHRLTDMLRVFVEAAEAEPSTVPSRADIVRARLLLDQRV